MPYNGKHTIFVYFVNFGPREKSLEVLTCVPFSTELIITVDKFKLSPCINIFS